MKKFIIASAAFLFCSLAFSQVKNYVGIARQKYSDAQIKFLENFCDKLQNRGYNSYAEYVDSFLKGGFGSAFVFVDKDGQNYVITNRHVVSQAESVSIEFENSDGSVKKFDNLSVVLSDDDIDLAILKFEGAAKPFKSGLSFYAGKIYDGQDVVSAGFPGLGGDPVWQFGKGSVTNAAARIKDLIDPSISTVIQHSAQIDAGNSGGPLLVVSKNSAVGYEVVGINSWKALGRDSTNFAIPASLAVKLIEKSKKPADDGSAKAERQKKFKETIENSSNDWTALARFVSYDYAAQEGVDAFDDVLRHASTKIKNRVAAEFAQNPIEGLRYATAYSLHSKFSGENATEENFSKIQWQKESGLFRIAGIDDPSKGKKDKAKKDTNLSSAPTSKKKKSGDESDKKNGKVSWQGFEGPYMFALSGGLVLPMGKDKPNIDLDAGFAIDAELFPGSGSWGVFFEFEQRKIAGESASLFGGGGTLRLPLNFGLFTICPKADFGAKFSFGKLRDLQFFADVGVNTTFNFGLPAFRPGFEVGCRGESNSVTYSGFSGESFTLKTADFYLKAVFAFEF